MNVALKEHWGERRHPRVLQNSLREEAEGMECAPGLEKLEWGVGQMEMYGSHQRTHRPWWVCAPHSVGNEKWAEYSKLCCGIIQWFKAWEIRQQVCMRICCSVT